LFLGYALTQTLVTPFVQLGEFILRLGISTFCRLFYFLQGKLSFRLVLSKKTGIGSAIMQSGCNQRDAKTLSHCLVVNGAEHQIDALAEESLQG
jgi:hypothetical protein